MNTSLSFLNLPEGLIQTLQQKHKGDVHDLKNFFHDVSTKFALYASEDVYSIQSKEVEEGWTRVKTIEGEPSGITDISKTILSKLSGQKFKATLYKNERTGEVQVAFKGTSSLLDLITDIDTDSVNFKYGKGKVHGGFEAAYESLRNKLDVELKKLGAKNVLFTGHSLGGALATLAGADTGLGVQSHVISFGSPQVGDKGFKEHYPKGTMVDRVINRNDPIPMLNANYFHPTDDVYDLGVKEDPYFYKNDFHSIKKYVEQVGRLENDKGELHYGKKEHDLHSKYLSDALRVVSGAINVGKNAYKSYKIAKELSKYKDNFAEIGNILKSTEITNAVSKSSIGVSSVDELLGNLQKNYSDVYKQIAENAPKDLSLLTSSIGGVKRIGNDIGDVVKRANTGVDAVTGVAGSISKATSIIGTALQLGDSISNINDRFKRADLEKDFIEWNGARVYKIYDAQNYDELKKLEGIYNQLNQNGELNDVTKDTFFNNLYDKIQQDEDGNYFLNDRPIDNYDFSRLSSTSSVVNSFYSNVDSKGSIGAIGQELSSFFASTFLSATGGILGALGGIGIETMLKDGIDKELTNDIQMKSLGSKQAFASVNGSYYAKSLLDNFKIANAATWRFLSPQEQKYVADNIALAVESHNQRMVAIGGSKDNRSDFDPDKWFGLEREDTRKGKNAAIDKQIDNARKIEDQVYKLLS